jgi:hypothetical protein
MSDGLNEVDYRNPQSFADLKSNFDKQFIWMIGAGLSLLLFIAIIAMSYSLGVDDAKKGAIPIISADGNPIKVQPTTQQSNNFSSQQISVYDQMSGKTVEPEKLTLKADENENNLDITPQTQKLIALQKEKQEQETLSQLKKVEEEKLKLAENKIKLDNSSKQSQVNAEQQIKKAIETPSKQFNNFQPQQKVDVKPAAVPLKIENKPKAEIKPESAKVASLPVKAVTPVAGGIAAIQLGAYRGREEALTAWKKIEGKFPSVRGYSPKIVEANLGAKGIYYRLRIVAPSKAAANTICSSLSAGSQACMVVTQ